MIKISLNKQIHIYSVDTSYFYNDSEMIVHNRLNRLYILRKNISDKINRIHKDDKDRIRVFKDARRRCGRLINKNKTRLKDEFKKTNQLTHIRELLPEIVSERNIISIFDSMLTRVIGLEINSLSEELIIVQTYFFDIIEDIIKNGFMYKGNKYICLTASAGQIRTKKTVFIQEKIFDKYKNTFMCGLTPEIINLKGGVNVNKYLAYLALSNSATDEWVDFDIDKSIVVDDFETMINTEVDYIDHKTYEIHRQFMDILIPHTDGCGMMLPTASEKNTMVRLPWVKGLLVNFNFKKFIQQHKAKGFSQCSIVKDIYGKEYDVIKDDIQYIFTKSQFKMWKYYDSWDDYKNKFKKYNCQVGKCNEEEDLFKKKKINYQMLQTLTDITNKELKELSKRSREDIVKISSDINTMLKVLGANEFNLNKNYFQQAVEHYPELLVDKYSVEVLKQIKKSLVKQGRSARLSIDGHYTFIIPDLYAFCEWLFLEVDNPVGLLQDGEVSCSLYENGRRLDCLRSPHLYREHAIRNNVVNDITDEWYTTNGIYTSVHDPISRILQFDVDGDQSLVVGDKLLVEIAERNMKDIVPLYYEMAKADAEIINKDSIYNGLKTAYTGGNIGVYSNDITKIWNSDNINLDVIKILCMENNFVIDYAKTLYKPTRPKKINELITQYTKNKTPNFFIYAKNKTKDKVEEINGSVVNRLSKHIPNPRLNFKKQELADFDYANLMSRKKIGLRNDRAKKIISTYEKLDKKKCFVFINPYHDIENDETVRIYIDIKDKLLEVDNDIDYVVDVLVKYLYFEKNSKHKMTLWNCFGDIVVRNLKNNIKNGYGFCSECGKIIRRKSVNSKIKYCDECAKKIKNEQNKKYYNQGKFNSFRKM